jgi:WD40 repeat protein
LNFEKVLVVTSIVQDAAGTVRHWHVTSGKCVHTINEEGNQVYAVDYSPDAEKFATAGKDVKVGYITHEIGEYELSLIYRFEFMMKQSVR